MLDAVLKTKERIYIIEFKLDQSAEIALQQIKDKKYYEPYLGNNKRVLLLGLGFLGSQLHGRVEEIK